MNKAEFLKMIDEWARGHICDGWELTPDEYEKEKSFGEERFLYKNGFLAASKWWATELLKVFAAPEAMDFKHKLDELRGLAKELLEDEKK